VERAAWTDERLDDLARRMDAGFDRVDQDIRDLRTEIGSVRNDLGGQIGDARTELGGQIGGLRAELTGQIGGLRAELTGQIDALRLALIRVGGGMIVAMLGMIAALIARG
jgi:hypothetical protein